MMQKILVIQTGKLGDMVCTTPVFRAIKKEFPDASLTVAGSRINKEILAGNPHINRYIEAENLKSERFDAAVLLNPNPAILKKILKARIPKIVVPKVVGGYSPLMSMSYRFWSLFATRVPHRMHHYAPQEYLNALAPLGIHSEDTRKELFITEAAQAAADKYLAPYGQKLKVAIAPGAGNKIKEWPPERFNEIAKHLVEKKGALVVLIGGPADAELAKIVAKDLPQGSVFDTTGRLSIEELKGLIKRMGLFVSADTGPIYIAEAFGVPTIDIVGPVDEREQPPIGSRHRVVAPTRTHPELFVMDARTYDAREARRQAEEATAGRVTAEIDDLLASLSII